MSIGSKIREFGESRYSTIKEFADALDMAPSNLQKYMADEFGVGTKILRRLRALGCDLNWLFDDNDKLNENVIIKKLTIENRELQNELNQMKKSFEMIAKVAEGKIDYKKK